MAEAGSKGVIMRRMWLLLTPTIALALVAVLIGVPGLTPTRAAAAPTFSDVPETHPYYAAIEGMAAANVISGYAVGDHWEFRPENLVTRAQFAKMIVLSLGLPVTEQDICTFPDVWEGVSPDLYPDHYIAVAAKKGITTGYANGKFGLLDNIKRCQISTMMVRASLNLEPGKLVEAPAGFVSDWGDIGDPHAAFANTAEYSGLFGELEFDFFEDPFKMATRGEVAQLLWNMKSFAKQTKTGTDLVTITDVTTTGTPAAIKAALEAKAGGPMDWIRRLSAEHPVNSTIHLNLYYGGRGGNYFSLASSPQGPIVAPLVATFLTYMSKFGAEVGYAYYDSTDPQNPKVAGVLDWRLGGDYRRQGTETLDAYKARIQPLMDSFNQQHADAEGFFALSDPAVRQLIKTSDSLGISRSSAGLAGVRDRVDFYRAYGYGEVIDKIAEEFWPWED
jgi:hypothetical protein